MQRKDVVNICSWRSNDKINIYISTEIISNFKTLIGHLQVFPCLMESQLDMLLWFCPVRNRTFKHEIIQFGHFSGLVHFRSQYNHTKKACSITWHLMTSLDKECPKSTSEHLCLTVLELKPFTYLLNFSKKKTFKGTSFNTCDYHDISSLNCCKKTYICHLTLLSAFLRCVFSVAMPVIFSRILYHLFHIFIYQRW